MDKKNSEEVDTIRPSFQGNFIRSIVNDNYNDEYYPPIKLKLKLIFSMFVSAGIIVISIIFVVLIIGVCMSFIKVKKIFSLIENKLFRVF